MMTQPDGGQEWEDLTVDPKEPDAVDPKGPDTARTGPFAIGVPRVDGYAFTPDLTDPELRYTAQPTVASPVTVRRATPRRIADQVRPTGVWRPGGSAIRTPTQQRMPRGNLLRALFSALIPLGLLAGGIYLVMRLYGF